MFIFRHSVVDLVGSLYTDICGMMVSLFVYADIGPLLPPGHRRWVITIAPVAVPTGSTRR